VRVVVEGERERERERERELQRKRERKCEEERELCRVDGEKSDCRRTKPQHRSVDDEEPATMLTPSPRPLALAWQLYARGAIITSSTHPSRSLKTSAGCSEGGKKDTAEEKKSKSSTSTTSKKTTDPKKNNNTSSKPLPDAKEEIGGPRGPEPTRYNDWEKNGRVSDF